MSIFSRTEQTLLPPYTATCDPPADDELQDPLGTSELRDSLGTSELRDPLATSMPERTLLCSRPLGGIEAIPQHHGFVVLEDAENSSTEQFSYGPSDHHITTNQLARQEPEQNTHDTDWAAYNAWRSGEDTSATCTELMTLPEDVRATAGQGVHPDMEYLLVPSFGDEEHANSNSAACALVGGPVEEHPIPLVGCSEHERVRFLPDSDSSPKLPR